jgi:hypothetical protein
MSSLQNDLSSNLGMIILSGSKFFFSICGHQDHLSNLLILHGVIAANLNISLPQPAPVASQTGILGIFMFYYE